MLIYDQLWRILEYSCLFGPTNVFPKIILFLLWS